MLDYVSRAHEIKFVRPSVLQLSLSKSYAQISFKFWLLVALGHTNGRLFEEMHFPTLFFFFSLTWDPVGMKFSKSFWISPFPANGGKLLGIFETLIFRVLAFFSKNFWIHRCTLWKNQKSQLSVKRTTQAVYKTQICIWGTWSHFVGQSVHLRFFWEYNFQNTTSTNRSQNLSNFARVMIFSLALTQVHLESLKFWKLKFFFFIFLNMRPNGSTNFKILLYKSQPKVFKLVLNFPPNDLEFLKS